MIHATTQALGLQRLNTLLPRARGAHRLLAAAALAALTCAPARAVDVPTLQDTFVSPASPGAGHGGWGTVKSGEGGAIGLISFDLAAALPAGTRAESIGKATLILYQEWVLGPGSIEVIRLISPFSEATTTYATLPTHMGAGSGRAAPLTGHQRYLLVDVTDMVKAAVTGASGTLGIALAAALATPGASVQLGSKEGRYPAKLDITLAAAPTPPAPSYAWLTSSGKLSCSSVCSGGGAIAVANGKGEVCRSRDGFTYSFEQYRSSTPLPGPPPGYWCGQRDLTAQCSCLYR